MRVKTGPKTRRRRKKIIKQASGYYGAKSLLYKKSKEQLMKSWFYAYRDRKKRKSNFRSLWIVRINNALEEHNISYSRFINLLTKHKIKLNRKVLSELATSQPEIFANIVKKVSGSKK